ncbi:flagellar export chaperone FliS [Paenibacillus sp. MSJ-34]|uniref:flagellar export chaperone FliS n=1 Tax=Paenibacillus sp. MSJ-34 TaxID=2841529 RepID=UPI0020A10A0C|nr:flagellar export chaperone FliS [Paenibacillus sp. MSJ-34]
MTNQTGYQAYQKNKYETASPHKLISMLYSGAIQYTKRAQTALNSNDFNDAHFHILRVQDIIFELMACLNEDEGGEIAANLRNLYLYMIDRLIQSNIKKDGEPLTEVVEMLKEIQSAWEQIGKDVTLGKTVGQSI